MHACDRNGCLRSGGTLLGKSMFAIWLPMAPEADWECVWLDLVALRRLNGFGDVIHRRDACVVGEVGFDWDQVIRTAVILEATER